MTDTTVEMKLEAALRDAHARAASEVKYNANRFKQMLDERGALATVQHLLSGDVTQVSEGFTQMALAGRLDLTVESIILQAEFSSLFTAEELKKAKQRLR